MQVTSGFIAPFLLLWCGARTGLLLGDLSVLKSQTLSGIPAFDLPGSEELKISRNSQTAFWTRWEEGAWPKEEAKVAWPSPKHVGLRVSPVKGRDSNTWVSGSE